MLNTLFIVWSKDFETNIPILDEQHRGLVSTMNSLYYLMKEHRTANVIQPTLAAIDHYREIHFMTEEHLMEITDYPQKTEHKKQHDLFRKHAELLVAKGRKTLDPSELLEFFKGWWLDHVRVSDRAYESHFREVLQKMGKL